MEYLSTFLSYSSSTSKSNIFAPSTALALAEGKTARS